MISLVLIAAMSARGDDSFPIETVRGVGMCRVYADGFHVDHDFKGKGLHELIALTNITQVTIFTSAGYWVKTSIGASTNEENFVKTLITTEHPFVEDLELKTSVEPTCHVHIAVKGDDDIVLEVYRHLNCAIVYKRGNKYFLKWNP